MNYLIETTREVYHCYMSGDHLLERPIGPIGRRNIGKERDDLIKRYITLIMNTKIVNEAMKIYLRGHSSVAATFKSHNQTLSEGDQIVIKTAQSNVNYSTKKLLEYFPDNMIAKLTSNSPCDLADYKKRLALAESDYAQKSKLLDNLMLKLPRVALQDYLDEEEFSSFIGLIAPFFKKHIKYLEDNLPGKAVGYMQFLMSSPQITSAQKVHYELLRNMLE